MTMPSTPTFSVLRAGMSIHGDLVSEDGFTCLALVTGNVRASHGLLHIGRGGGVHGDVEGEHIIIDGTVEGDVKSRVSLKINGRVIGRIFYAGTIRLGENVTLEGSSITRVPAVGYVASPQKEDAPAIHIDDPEVPGTAA